MRLLSLLVSHSIVKALYRHFVNDLSRGHRLLFGKFPAAFICDYCFGPDFKSQQLITITIIVTIIVNGGLINNTCCRLSNHVFKLSSFLCNILIFRT